MILSNKVNININRENIDKDFDIFCISKNKGNYFKSNILDKISTEFKAKSVVYNYGSEWFVMFDKGTCDFDSIKRLIAVEDEDSIIKQLNIYDEESIATTVLSQLLFNTLKIPKTKEMTFSNVSGNLYYIRGVYMKDMPKSFYAVKIRLTYKYCIELKVQTFSCIKYINDNNKPEYIFDSDLGIFRRKLKTDNFDNSKIYIQKALNKKAKNTITFLDFKSYDKFCDSRSGIYAEFMKDVKEYLNNYITVEFSEYTNYNNYELENNDFENRDYKNLLQGKGFYIIDEIKNNKSSNLIERLKYELTNFYGVTNFYDEYNDDLYVIRIIHNKEHYKDEKINDIYNKNKYSILQHITLEDFSVEKGEKPSVTIKKIIQELLIKYDIKNNRLSTVNWDYKNKINFVCAKKIYTDNKSNEKSFFRFYRMTINTDGTFVIETQDSNIYTEDKEWNVIFNIYTENEKDYTNEEIEGLVYYDYSNINIIRKTKQCTLPNVIKLEENLYLSNKTKEVKIDTLLKALDNFKNINHYEDLDELYSKLEKYPFENIQIGEVLNYLSIRKKSMSEFNRYLYETEGILLHSTPKTKEFKNIYFDGVLDIKYFYKFDKLYYFVGIKNKSLNLSIPNACIIREVESKTGNIFFDEIIKLLSVEFVKNGFYTVVPFPFKYLNEFIKKFHY